MRVYNGYAGIGGNRHLWPSRWFVTAVESDPRIAAEYARRYPDDEVIVTDAHQYLLDNAHAFDASWVSPPCPSHSKLAPSVAARLGTPLEPDPTLWEEITFLRDLGRPYVVENVHTYYTPPIAPDIVTPRHYYWTNAVPDLLTPPRTNVVSPRTSAAQFARIYCLPPVPKGAVSDARHVLRNAVDPQEGLEIAFNAFYQTGAIR